MVVFGKSFCPFTIEAIQIIAVKNGLIMQNREIKKIVDELAKKNIVIYFLDEEYDKVEDSNEILTELQKISLDEKKTVPRVFINDNKEAYGIGCDGLKKLMQSGKY